MFLSMGLKFEIPANSLTWFEDHYTELQGCTPNQYISNRVPSVSGSYKDTNLTSYNMWLNSSGYIQAINPTTTPGSTVLMGVYPKLRDMFVGESLTVEIQNVAVTNGALMNTILRNLYYNFLHSSSQWMLYTTSNYTTPIATASITAITNPVRIIDNQTSLKLYEFYNDVWNLKINYPTTLGSPLLTSTTYSYEFYNPVNATQKGGVSYIKFQIS